MLQKKISVCFKKSQLWININLLGNNVCVYIAKVWKYIYLLNWWMASKKCDLLLLLWDMKLIMKLNYVIHANND